MKITKLTKRLGRTINTSGHNFIKIEVELEATLGEDTIAEVDAKLFNDAQQILADDLKRIKEKRKDASKNA